MAVNDLFSVNHYFVCENKEFTTSFAMRQSAGVDSNAIGQDLLTAWLATIPALLLACLSPSCLLMSIRVLRITSPHCIPARATFTSGEVGTLTGDPLPTDSAVNVRLVTDDPFGAHNGHLYIAGIPENQLSNGQFVTGFIGAGSPVRALTNAYQTGFSGTGLGNTYVPCVVRRYAAGLKLVPPQYSNIVTMQGQATPASLRKRLNQQLFST